MKRSTSIRLAALGSIPLALAFCHGERRPTRTVSETTQYTSVEACTGAGVAAEVCSKAYRVAYELHRKRAPSYDNLADCEADYAIGTCVDRSENGRITPALTGFAVTTQREVPADQPTTSSGGGSYHGSGGSSFWRWISLGDDDSPRYSSEPTYRERVGQDGSRMVTLSQQVNEGKTFAKAKSGRFAVSSPESFNSSLRVASAEPVHVSRGGFGSRGGFSFGG